jgi:hypothetical protein
MASFLTLMLQPASLLFVGFNILDAYLTGIGNKMGAAEALPWARSFSSNMPVKGLLAAAIVLFLYWRGREGSLWWMNIIVFGVCLWNFGNCAYGHLVGGYPWG